MIDIKTMNEQHKQCKKITNTLFSVEKTKKLKISKMAKKSGLEPPFMHTTNMVKILMMSAKMATPDLLKIKIF